MDEQILVIDRHERVTILPGILPDRFRVIWHASHGREVERFQVPASVGETVLQAVTKELRRRRVAQQAGGDALGARASLGCGAFVPTAAVEAR